MIYTREQLEGMKMAQLKHLSAEMGEISPPSDTKELLIQKLLLATAKQPEVLPNMEQKKETSDDERPQCTIEQVKQSVNGFILRGMKVFYDKESNCWLFRVQLKSMTTRDSNTGETRLIERWRDDSGTLSQPLSVITRCASVLMQGAPTPAQIKPEINPADSYEVVA